jgi:ABC-type glycerol-3-phosphate transport system permease component
MTAVDSDLVTGHINRGIVARISAKTGSGVLQIFLIVVAVFWLLPTFGLLIESLRNSGDYAAGGWWQALSHPAQLTWSNYSELLKNHQLTTSFFNSIKITVPATLAVVLIGSAAGYAFAWMNFPGRDWFFLIIVGLLVIPLQIALIPTVKLYRDLHISGSILSVVIFHVAFGLPFAIFLLRNFFAGIPKDLMEAARMDGASEGRIFFRIVLPLGAPAIAALAIFQFLWVWNDLLVALVFSNAKTQPLTVYLSTQTREFGSSINVLAPGAFVSLIVPLAVFIAFQRFFVEGITAGAVK